MATRKEHKDAAATIRAAAKDVRASANTASARRLDLVEMYIEDARDLRKVAQLLTAGKLAEAAAAACSMDTAAREHIPMPAWEIIHGREPFEPTPAPEPCATCGRG